jgi:ATP-dependent DNA helicase RecQ
VRCCDVCEQDPELSAAIASAGGRRRRAGRGAGGRTSAASGAGRPEQTAGRPEQTFTVPEPHFEALRAWRLSRAEGKPAFTVASDATLRELIHRGPSSVDELLEVRGVGPAFCAKHGESLLEELGRLPAAQGERRR